VAAYFAFGAITLSLIVLGLDALLVPVVIMESYYFALLTNQ